MVVSGFSSLTEPHSINDRSVIKSVADDKIFGGVNGLKETGVGIKTTGEKNCVLGIVVSSDNFFELFVDILGAADKSD